MIIPPMPHLSVVIPVYQAQDCLDELCRRLKTSLEPLTADFEILLVEDGGRDDGWKKITELSAADARIRGLRLSRNFGQHYAITAGLDHCDGDWVVVMDCDLQDRPEEIPRLYAKAREGFEIVLARRSHRRDGTPKRWRSFLFYKVLNYFSDVEFDPTIGNFRILSRKVVEAFRQMRERLRFLGGLTQWLGFRSAAIDVEHDKRFSGRSAYTFAKLRRLAADSIIAYSDKPMRMFTRFGFLISAVAFGFGLYLIFRALIFGSPVMGWASLMVSIYFLGGIIIAILGIIGVYLGKTFDECKKRPLYVIAERAGQLEKH